MILSFDGDYDFLSNFYPSPFIFNETVFPTVEHAYQSSKALYEYQRDYILNATGPGEAKRRGRKVIKRPNWEEEKLSFMELYLYCKFLQNEDLLKRLIWTGDRELIEGNTWGDTFWGVCNGIGENHLGKLLMEIRVDLKNPSHSKKLPKLRL